MPATQYFKMIMKAEYMLTYGELLGILQSFDEKQLRQPAMIHIKDSEYLQQAQQVFVPGLV